MDSSNAFNNLALINTYRSDTQLFVDGETFLSQEGTTQRDPLAMAMYAISTMPVIQCLNHSVQQVWCADDATALFLAKLVEQAANCQGRTDALCHRPIP